MPTSTYAVEDQERMAEARNYFAWQSRLVRPELGQRVVEVGCGIGNFTGALLDRESVIALDPDEDSLTRLLARFPGRANLHVLRSEPGVPSFADLRGFKPDTCVCLNVLEHIAEDGDALRSMAAILVPGGKVILLVPAFPSLYGPIDRNLHHYRRYTRASLHALAKSCDLTIAKLHYFNVAGLFGWWWNAHVAKRETQSPAQIRFFDRFVVPVMSRLEDVIAPPFGQSLMAVLRVNTKVG